MRPIAFVAIGGAAGSVLRYLISGWSQRFFGSPFPLGTMLVNTLGCFVMGICAATLLGSQVIREEYRLGIIVGILGGYTTFSAYSWDTLQLYQNGEIAQAALSVLGNNFLALFAVWAGYRLGHLLLGVS